MRQLVAKALTSFAYRRVSSSCWAFMCQLVNEFAGMRGLPIHTMPYHAIPPSEPSIHSWQSAYGALTYLLNFWQWNAIPAAITVIRISIYISVWKAKCPSFCLECLSICCTRLAEWLFICRSCLPFWFAVRHILAALQHFDGRWQWKIVMEILCCMLIFYLPDVVFIYFGLPGKIYAQDIKQIWHLSLS